MKRSVIYFIVGMIFFSCLPSGLAILSPDDLSSKEASLGLGEHLGAGMEEEPLPVLPQGSTSSEKAQGLSMCTDAKLGVQFLCDPDWKIETETDVLLVIIAEQPSLTMAITKEESALASLEELTMPIIKEMGSYADGFDVNRTRLNDRAIIEVQGVSQKVPGLQLRDYYFVEHDNLYGVLFSAPSQEALAKRDLLIQKIMESFSFIPLKSNE